MRILIDPAISAQPGDFQARAQSGDLWVGQALGAYAAQARLATAKALYGYADAFPSSLALALGWSVPEAQSATQGLKDLLLSEGELTARDLAPPTPRAFGFNGPEAKSS